MNPIALYFASGEAFYPSALLLLIVILVSPRATQRWPIRLRNLGAWVAIFLMALACPPFPWVQDMVFVLVFLLWFIAWNKGTQDKRWRLICKLSACSLVLMLLLFASLEFGHRAMPKITGTPSDHLVVIGDSISAGINPRVPTWPQLLEAKTGIPVINLARAGAQADDVLTIATKVKSEDGVILIEIGGNDLLNDVPSEEFGKRLDALLSEIAAPGRTIVMFELPLLPHKIGYGQIQRRLAAQYNVFLIPKRFFVQVIGAADATSDGLHLSASGGERMASLVENALRNVLVMKKDPGGSK